MTSRHGYRTTRMGLWGMSNYFAYLWMDEILHQLGWTKLYEIGRPPINWWISSIHSITCWCSVGTDRDRALGTNRLEIHEKETKSGSRFISGSDSISHSLHLSHRSQEDPTNFRAHFLCFVCILGGIGTPLFMVVVVQHFTFFPIVV